MSIVRLSTGRMFLKNASHLYMTPYTSEDTVGTTTYDVISIVGDTISIEPDDNEVNEVPWEFGDTPLIENITLGKINFAATCIDMQNAVLKNLMGWNETTDGVFAPVAYADLYCAAVITFHDATSPVVVIPKLKINSKAVLQSLKTGTAEGQLSGTAYSAKVASASTASTLPIYNVAMFGSSAPTAVLALGSIFVDTTNEKVYTVIDNNGTIEWNNGVAATNYPSAYFTNGAVTYSWDGSNFSLETGGVPAGSVAIETTMGFMTPTAGAHPYIDGGNGSFVNVLA